MFAKVFFFFSWLSTCSATSKSLNLQRCQVADAALLRASGQSSLGAVQSSKQTLQQAQHEDVPKIAPWKWDITLSLQSLCPGGHGEIVGCKNVPQD